MLRQGVDEELNQMNKGLAEDLRSYARPQVFILSSLLKIILSKKPGT